jgi:hypothetical protein
MVGIRHLLWQKFISGTANKHFKGKTSLPPEVTELKTPFELFSYCFY